MTRVAAVMVFSLCCVALAPLPSVAEEKVAVTPADCRRLVAAVPAADVAYKGGVDVHGKKVVGADLPGGGNDLKLVPDVIAFTYTVNPAGYGPSKSLAQQSASLNSQSGAISAKQSSNSAAQVANQQAIAAATQQKAALVQAATKLAANSQALKDNQAAQARAQAAIDSGNAAAPQLSQQGTSLLGQQQGLASQQSAVASQQSSLAATQGNTQMPVAKISYDMARNVLTINGQPIGSADESALADECRKRGLQ